MLLKLQGFKNKQIRRFLEHSIYLTITLVLIPAFLFFELCVVLPAIIEEWSIAYFIHLCNATFLLFNIVGNMIYGMFTNTSVKGRNIVDCDKEDVTMCDVCECLRPPRAWHCTICDVCILKRDHHCTFFACCVGYFNHRYFMWFTFYMFVAMIYSFYYNIKFISLFITWNHGLVILKFMLPLASFVIDFGEESLYIFLVVINFFISIFTGFLFFYHFYNLLKGRIVYETKSYTKDFIYNRGWKSNVIEVFGSKWYLTWISPFIQSKLPGNGVEWHIDTKQK